MNACCAPPRWWSTKAGPADPDRPAGRGRAAHRQQLGLRFGSETDCDLTDPQDDRYRDYWQPLSRAHGRRGVSPDAARTIVRTRPYGHRRLMVEMGEADAGICGTVGRYQGDHFSDVRDIIGLNAGAHDFSAVTDADVAARAPSSSPIPMSP